MSIKYSLHYAKISKLISQESQHKLGQAGILLGARYGALDGVCDNCKKDQNTYTVIVMKPIAPRYYHTIHILCESCRLIHADEVKYYIYLNK